ncbi:MAG: hypothetical protein ACREEM_11105 [Blastocatellia bacterium]
MIQRVDDTTTISNDDLLLRRIVNKPEWLSRNEDGSWRVSSAAFVDRYTGEVSIHLARLTTPENALAGRPDEGLVDLFAILPRSIGLIVVYDPKDDDPSHSLICAPSGSGVSKSKARKLADAARWLVKPKDIRE